MKTPDLRTLEISTKSDGNHVMDTQQLKGEAKDGLSGTNVMKQYTTSGDASPGETGGIPCYGKC